MGSEYTVELKRDGELIAFYNTPVGFETIETHFAFIDSSDEIIRNIEVTIIHKFLVDKRISEEAMEMKIKEG